MKKKKNQTSVMNRYLLIGLSVFCIFMMLLSSFSDKVGGPFKVVANVTVIPLQQGINQIGGWMGDMKDNFQTLKEVRAENTKLQKQVDSLITENNNLQQERYELQRLQELYQLDKNYADYKKTAAHVIGKDSGNWFNVFTINKGSKDGIQEDMNVIADGGLVGIVTSVGSNWATVRSIIDDYSNVSAEISSTSDNCIIAGNLKLIDEGKISLVKLTDADNKVTVGDKVVTSEISNRFLPGILIGYVSEIGMDSNNLTKSGSITPVVDFRHLHEVLVITQLKNTDEAQKDIQSQAQSETEMILETETGKQTESSKQAGGEQ